LWWDIFATGPFLDILKALHGQLAYDPALVQAPVAIVRGGWDGLMPDEDARWLFDAFRCAPIKRDIKIDRTTHLMHLEAMRFALYNESINCLRGDDQPVLEPTLDERRAWKNHRGGQLMDVAAELPNISGYTHGYLGVGKVPALP
jgi:hypothetical protein